MCNTKAKFHQPKEKSFNPLYIGSMCNMKFFMRGRSTVVSIPFISGQCVIEIESNKDRARVSIPFISGQCVMIIRHDKSYNFVVSIPFISGQCVIWKQFVDLKDDSFNPLYIGSMCNERSYHGT